MLIIKSILFVLSIAISSVVDASSKQTGADEKSYGRCEIVVLRQRQPSKLDLVGLGVSTRGVSGSSYWFSAPKGISVDDFISVSNDEVRKTLKRQLLAHGVNGNIRLMIDIENPVHPKHFTRYMSRHGEKAFSQLIAAFKRRVDIARELLPEARIGIYGMPTPTSSDRNAARLSKQMSGIQAAANMGLLDSVDDIYPTLYLRFGPDDRKYKVYIEEMTRSGIESAMKVRRADGSAPGVVPLFSYKIFNGGSANHREIAPVELGRLQWKIAQSTKGISAIAYWIARDEIEFKLWLEALDPAASSCKYVD
jgi:hypothetical protein